MRQRSHIFMVSVPAYSQRFPPKDVDLCNHKDE